MMTRAVGRASCVVTARRCCRKLSGFHRFIGQTAVEMGCRNHKLIKGRVQYSKRISAMLQGDSPRVCLRCIDSSSAYRFRQLDVPSVPSGRP